jgi:hypothetical protein
LLFSVPLLLAIVSSPVENPDARRTIGNGVRPTSANTPLQRRGYRRCVR